MRLHSVLVAGFYSPSEESIFRQMQRTYICPLWHVRFYFDNCNASHYSRHVIKSFRHAGLEKFFLTGSKAGIQPAHAKKLIVLLTELNVAEEPRDMGFRAWELHELKGNLTEHWSIKVNGNWRITFKFEEKDAILVDYQDYH